ncbi:MAG: DNA recombination protein RmuC [Sedimentisphaeraceae bacterium JB056]
MTLTIVLILTSVTVLLILISGALVLLLNKNNSRLSQYASENNLLNEKCTNLEQAVDNLKEKESENTQLKTENARLCTQLEDRLQLKEQVEKYRQEINSLGSQNSALKTTIEQQQKAIDEKIKLLETAESKFKDVFQSLSAEVLKSSSTQFLELARQNLEKYQNDAKLDLEKRHIKFDQLIKPITETLGSVDKKIAEVEKERQSSFRVLDEQIKSLKTSEDMLKNETSNLVNALRRPTVRGRWGEMQLRKVVEMAGMVKYCDFVEQFSGDSIRPDMIINLPNCRSIIIDAKTPLEAYLNSVEATDETRREHYLSEHARHVHNHMKALGTKSYWQQFDQSPEFVVMFLPGEMFFSAALEKMPQLIEKGIESKVILSTPTTLIALLQSVAYGWRQEQLAENAKKISDLGKNLYERLNTLTGHFSTVGKSLDRATDSYNKAVGSLETRVLVAARKFEELGTGNEGTLKSPTVVENRPRDLSES